MSGNHYLQLQQGIIIPTADAGRYIVRECELQLAHTFPFEGWDINSKTRTIFTRIDGNVRKVDSEYGPEA